MKDVIKKSGIRCAFGFSLAPRIDKEALKSLLIKKQRLGPVEMADLYNNFRKYSSNYDKCHNHHYDRLVSCGAGMYSCEISAYGKLNKCAYFDEPNIDLRKTKFIDAWHSLKIDKTPMMDKKKACGDCLFKSSCAWCPGLAYMETGYSDRKVEYLCRLMRALEKKPKNA
jgi:radical SAM protein with 4Fe4S-binding SPASM domain